MRVETHSGQGITLRHLNNMHAHGKALEIFKKVCTIDGTWKNALSLHRRDRNFQYIRRHDSNLSIKNLNERTMDHHYFEICWSRVLACIRENVIFMYVQINANIYVIYKYIYSIICSTYVLYYITKHIIYCI